MLVVIAFIQVKTDIRKTVSMVAVSPMSDVFEPESKEAEITLSGAIISIAILLFACYMTYITFLTFYDTPMGFIILGIMASIGAVFLYILMKRYNLFPSNIE